MKAQHLQILFWSRNKFYAYPPQQDKVNLTVCKITLLLQANHKRLIQLKQFLASNFSLQCPESKIKNTRITAQYLWNEVLDIFVFCAFLDLFISRCRIGLGVN